MSKLFLSVLICALLLSLVITPLPASAISPSSRPLISGIDVSFYQEDIDFNQAAASGVKIVYIRSSLGSDYIDPKFEQNYQRASSAGLSIGFYHYVTARSVPQAEYQAQFFVNAIQGKDFDCRLAMDFEDLKGLTVSEINEIGLAFAQAVEELSGKEIVIYSDSYNAAYSFEGTITSYPLWVAEYGVSSPSDRSNWSFWTGWQYTDSGSVPGIGVNVDLDYFTAEIYLDSPGRADCVSPPKDSSSHTVNYTVKRGDTLWGIALLYHTGISQITLENHLLNPNLIYPGERLRIPIQNQTPAANTRIRYTVKPGDTLWAISRKYHAAVSSIVSINGITNPNLIYPGETLYLPSTDTAANPDWGWYTVKPGDTLWAISLRYQTTVNALAEANHLSEPNLIYPGMRLLIP